MDLPVASCVDFYTVRTLLGRLGGLGKLLVLVLLRGLGVASLLVDVDFLTVLGTANALLLGDVHFLLDVGVVVDGLGRLGLGGMDGGGEGFVDLFFVTFPSV
jgi:hypothetical protein